MPYKIKPQLNHNTLQSAAENFDNLSLDIAQDHLFSQRQFSSDILNTQELFSKLKTLIYFAKLAEFIRNFLNNLAVCINSIDIEDMLKSRNVPGAQTLAPSLRNILSDTVSYGTKDRKSNAWTFWNSPKPEASARKLVNAYCNLLSDVASECRAAFSQEIYEEIYQKAYADAERKFSAANRPKTSVARVEIYEKLTQRHVPTVAPLLWSDYKASFRNARTNAEREGKRCSERMLSAPQFIQKFYKEWLKEDGSGLHRSDLSELDPKLSKAVDNWLTNHNFQWPDDCPLPDRKQKADIKDAIIGAVENLGYNKAVAAVERRRRKLKNKELSPESGH